MASYSQPSSSTIQSTTGVNLDAFGLTSGALDTLIASLRTNAEADVAGQVTDAVFDSANLTARQAVTLQEAVCWATGARYLRRLQMEKGEGVFEPLLSEDSRSLSEIIADFTDEAARLCAIVGTGQGTAVQSVRQSFGDDTEALRLFTKAMDW